MNEQKQPERSGRWIILAAVFFSIYGNAQSVVDDPFDLSALENETTDLGIVTIADLVLLEDRSRQLFNDGQCDSALPALQEYARKANYVANIIAAGLDPFYGASTSERRDFTGVATLILYESKANELKAKRNIAMVMQAECLHSMGDEEAALALFRRALDLLDIDNRVWWDRAREGLYQLIEYE